MSRDIERPAAVNQEGATELPHPRSRLTDLTAREDSSVSISDIYLVMHSYQNKDERHWIPMPGCSKVPHEALGMCELPTMDRTARRRRIHTLNVPYFGGQLYAYNWWIEEERHHMLCPGGLEVSSPAFRLPVAPLYHLIASQPSFLDY